MKATKAQVRQRVEEVLAIILDGASFVQIRQYVSEKQEANEAPWTAPDGKPLSDRTLWRYIAEANKLIAESCRETRKRTLQRHLAQRRNLYARAVNTGDYSAALRCLRDEAALLDLYPNQQDQLQEQERRIHALERELTRRETRDANRPLAVPVGSLGAAHRP